MAVDSIFIDTNVLVFASIPASPFHGSAIQALHRLALAGTVGWISRQVLREYLVQITRPGVLPTPLFAQVAANQITSLMSLYRVADETSQVTSELLGLIGQGLAAGKQVHDANIVATCLAFGIPRLLTHNLSDFRRFGSQVIVESL